MLIKRWIALLIVSVCMVGLALAMGSGLDLPGISTFRIEFSGGIRTLTLQFIAHPYRELIILVGRYPDPLLRYPAV